MAFLAACNLLGKSIYSNLEVHVIFMANLKAFEWLKSKICDSRCTDWKIKQLIQQGVSLLRANDFSSKIRFWKSTLDTPHNTIYGNRKNKVTMPDYSDFDMPF